MPAAAGPPTQEAAKPTESRSAQPPGKPAEAPTTRPDPATGRAAPSDATPALPRSESLGLQPSQAPASPSTGTAATTAPRSSVPIWPVPNLLQQVDGGIRWMLRNAAQGAELQLHPETLGRVRIELKVEGGDVHARLWASDPKSLPVLQENKAILEVSLKEQGLNLGSFDLRQQSQQPQSPFTDQGSRGQFWPTEAKAAEPGQDAPILAGGPAMKPHRIELIA